MKIMTRKFRGRVSYDTTDANELYHGFKENSCLEQYLKKKIPLREFNTLRSILVILREIIRNEKMFDETNPCIILCSPEFEKAINMKALHVSEIKNVVVSQMYPLDNDAQYLLGVTPGPYMNLQRQIFQHIFARVNGSPVQSGGNRITQDDAKNNQIYSDEKNTFILHPNLYKVFECLPSFEKKPSFTYMEIITMFSAYVIMKKKTLFDLRNIKVALVENDPLGTAFGVKSFHRCQSHHFLKKNMTLKKEDDTMEETC